MDNLLKIVRINGYIQRKMGNVYMHGKQVLCVALDSTCTFFDEGAQGVELSSDEIQDLFMQTFGASPAHPERKE